MKRQPSQSSLERYLRIVKAIRLSRACLAPVSHYFQLEQARSELHDLLASEAGVHRNDLAFNEWLGSFLESVEEST